MCGAAELNRTFIEWLWRSTQPRSYLASDISSQSISLRTIATLTIWQFWKDFRLLSVVHICHSLGLKTNRSE